MALSNGQVDRLRSALNRYRMAKGQHGQVRPWKAVVDDIIRCPDTSCSYDKDMNAELKEEALRRFAAGKTLQASSLNDVLAFLIFAKVIKREAFDGEDPVYAEAVTVHGCLGLGPEAARHKLSTLPSVFGATRELDGRREEIRLKIDVDTRAGFFLVEEEWAISEEVRTSRLVAPQWTVIKRSTRYGYGFVSTADYLLHLFLVGSHNGDRVTYVQASTVAVASRDCALMRAGDGMDSSAQQEEESPTGLVPIYRFSVLEKNIVKTVKARNPKVPPPSADLRGRVQ